MALKEWPPLAAIEGVFTYGLRREADTLGVIGESLRDLDSGFWCLDHQVMGANPLSALTDNSTGTLTITWLGLKQ